ncbi:MAG: BrnA antitoxin family protein [Acidobacteriaceae bacterium]
MAGKSYRPPKKPVTMRLDADVVDWLKSYGRGYQTRANALLRHAMENTRGKRRPA